ncbi:MAG: nucleoside deaminase [Oceanococcaceae bacterium]
MHSTHDPALVAQLLDKARAALAAGNYPVAAIIADDQGRVMAEAENTVFSAGFDSAAHAEMRVLNTFERLRPCSPRQAHLLVLLEPCPMCTTRLLYAGLASVIYVVPDPDGGMLRHIRRLPPAWRDLARLQDHRRADISHALQQACADIVGQGASERRERWRKLMGLQPPT